MLKHFYYAQKTIAISILSANLYTKQSCPSPIEQPSLYMG